MRTHELGADGMPLCASSRFRRWIFRVFGFAAALHLANCKECRKVRFSREGGTLIL